MDCRTIKFECDLSNWLTKLRNIITDSEAQVFSDILLCLRAFCDQRLNADEVVANVAKYISNKDIPNDSFIVTELAELLESSTQQFDENNHDTSLSRTTCFVETFKARYPQIFPHFLNLLTDYETGLNDVPTIREAVEGLIPNDQELRQEFAALIGMPNSGQQTGPTTATTSVVGHLSSESIHEASGTSMIDNEAATTTASITENVDPTIPRNGDSFSISNAEAIRTTGEDVGKAIMDHLRQQTPMLSRDVDEAVRLFKKIAAEMGSKTTFLSFVKLLALYLHGCISLSEFLLVVEGIFPMHVPNLPAQLKQFLVSRETYRRRTSQFIVPLSELNFTGCLREGKSYLKLPDTFRRLWCEGREHEPQEILNQLNDDFVSIPQGSEEDAFGHIKRNPYEEMMFHLEDEMFELDVMIGGLESVVKKLEPLEIEILELTLPKRAKYQLPQQLFSARHLKALALVYGDHGSEILEFLRRCPGLAVGPLLSRVKEKVSEWREARTRLTEGPWRESACKNFYKQFEKRAHYLKALDRFILGPSALVNQAIVQYSLLHKQPINSEVYRKSKYILRQICHTCGGFPGCPNIPRNQLADNSHNRSAISYNNSSDPGMESDVSTRPLPRADNGKSIESCISTLNVHIDHPFGYTEEPNSYRRYPEAFDPPEFEFHGMTDQEIHRNVLSLFAVSSRRSYGTPLSTNQNLTLQRVRRFLINIILRFFRMPGNEHLEYLEPLEVNITHSSSSDESRRELIVTEDSETSPELQAHPPPLDSNTPASEAETSIMESQMERSFKDANLSVEIPARQQPQSASSQPSSARQSISSTQEPPVFDSSPIEDEEGLTDLQNDSSWKQILLTRQINRSGDLLNDWKMVVKTFFDSDVMTISGAQKMETEPLSLSENLNSNYPHMDLSAVNSSLETSKIALFGNEAIYCIIRFYCQLYERLSKVKLLINQRKDPEDPSAKISWATDDPGVEGRLSYPKFFESILLKVGTVDLPHEVFEDALRIAAGNDAVFLITLSTILGTLSRFWSTLLNDIDVLKLSALFLAYHQSTINKECLNVLEEYQIIARATLGPQGLLFRIEYEPKVGYCSIRLYTNRDYNQFLASLPIEGLHCPKCQSKALYQFRMKESGLGHHVAICHTNQKDLLRIALGIHIVRVASDDEDFITSSKMIITESNPTFHVGLRCDENSTNETIQRRSIIKRNRMSKDSSIVEQQGVNPAEDIFSGASRKHPRKNSIPEEEEVLGNDETSKGTTHRKSRRRPAGVTTFNNSLQLNTAAIIPEPAVMTRPSTRKGINKLTLTTIHDEVRSSERR